MMFVVIVGYVPLDSPNGACAEFTAQPEWNVGMVLDDDDDG